MRLKCATGLAYIKQSFIKSVIVQSPESKKPSVNHDTECLITMHGKCPLGLVYIKIYAKFHKIWIIDAISVRLSECRTPNPHAKFHQNNIKLIVYISYLFDNNDAAIVLS